MLPSGLSARYFQRLPGTSGRYGLSIVVVKFAGSSVSG